MKKLLILFFIFLTGCTTYIPYKKDVPAIHVQPLRSAEWVILEKYKIDAEREFRAQEIIHAQSVMGFKAKMYQDYLRQVSERFNGPENSAVNQEFGSAGELIAQTITIPRGDQKITPLPTFEQFMNARGGTKKRTYTQAPPPPQRRRQAPPKKSGWSKTLGVTERIVRSIATPVAWILGARELRKGMGALFDTMGAMGQTNNQAGGDIVSGNKSIAERNGNSRIADSYNTSSGDVSGDTRGDVSGDAWSDVGNSDEVSKIILTHEDNDPITTGDISRDSLDLDENFDYNYSNTNDQVWTEQPYLLP